ncbi:DUF3971 domain-containing protein [Falsiroseomonas sp. E2-1-a20]|uniref:DUF3971 domain-containing protein n=1 Tax=Falsiroseomonas sp. E2-1-a20 TaxID=3239300 RepID=UPI003F350E6F
MRAAAGQVAREAHRALHLLFGLFFLLLLATGALAWRLSTGPVELPWLASTIEDQANAPGADGTPPDALLEVGRAAVGWQGWREGRLTPVELQLSQVRMREPDGSLRLDLPDAAITLSLPWLLRGQVAPQQVEMRRPALRLRRSVDGEVTLLVGQSGTEAPDSATTDPMLAELMRAPSDDTWLSALRLVRIVQARVVVEDAALGLTWTLDDADLVLRRRPGGGVSGTATATLLLGAERVPVSGSAEIVAGGAAGGVADIAFRLLLPELRPALLAAAAPGLAPLARLDATARIEVAGRIDSAGRFRDLQARLAAGVGSIDVGPGPRLAIERLEVALEATRDRLLVPAATLVLAGPSPPTLTLAAEASRADDTWRGTATLGLDAVPIADLGRHWPEALAPPVRRWMVQNLTAGTARDGQWRLAGQAAADGSGLRVTELSGRLAVQDATVHWLRPIPPAELASGTVDFDLQAITMQVTGGRQAGVVVRDGTVRFLLPPQGQDSAEIAINLAGPVADAIAVVKHPRLRLFERAPLPIKDPRGQMEGRLEIAFPLLSDLPVEQLQIRVQARLRQATIADVLLGRPLEGGVIDLNVTNTGLRATGTATFAGIAARLTVEMDFRAGPASQVVRRETVRATTNARTIAELGLDLTDLVEGPVGLDVATETRRSGQGRATIKADLRNARMMIDPLAWAKPPGQNAGAEVVLRLNGETLLAMDSFRVEAPALLVRGAAAFGRGARMEQLIIQDAAVEESRLSGEALPPAEPGAPWVVTLRGPVLDLRRAFAAEEARAEAPAAEDRSPAFSANARIDRVLMGPGREIGAVQARVQVDARGVVRAGSVTGRAGPRGNFQADIAPAGAGRSLRLEAEDAGALLGAFDVLRTLEGGRLSVQAAYASNRPGAPLVGTAVMNDFAMRNAPGFAKLLQAMTLYGVLEAVAGPGLGFTQLVAPFSLTPEVLTLGEARAFSASLGLTAKGTLNRRTRRLAIEGTIVPAYFFNSLLGNLPIIGRLFAPEAGGGLFAATFQLNGPAEDPQVSVNPLAALTPGFLRGLFGIGQAGPAAP